ncbi:MAG: NAD(P)/FAD-dependent oxidoreductase [Myxococcales bacterium]|nr:NAD(P)/FAD-dependent oxidoreductase [Myxococcales bacterium]
MNTLVVGAGQAGLAMSRCLQREGIEHVVLERQSVGSSWRERWDSFHLNTPGRINVLPDADVPGAADAFLHRDEWVAYMDAYRAKHELPIRCDVEVRAIVPAGAHYEVETQDGLLRARNVILCSGDQNAPRVPKLAAKLPEDIEQLHSQRYRSAAKLPPGAVLVVGSAQTGTQIVEDLLEAGRKVWLCTSEVGRPPRRYRGRDITGWIDALGMADQRPADVPAEERKAPQGMISGVAGGHSVSLQLLAHSGAKLLGRLAGIEGRTLHIGDELMANVAVGDASVAKLRAGVDMAIAKLGLDAPAAEPDPADRPYPGLEEMAGVRSLDLDAENIRTVIWATGFGGDFSYLPGEFLDEKGLPRHEGGVIEPGLYCLGLMWLRRRLSGLIAGVSGDAEAIVEQLKQAGRTS